MHEGRSPRLAFLGMLFLAALFLRHSGGLDGRRHPAPQPGDKWEPPFAVAAGRGDYSPAMSVAPGLAFSAQLPESAPKGLTFRWRTDFGYFVRWNAPDFKVEALGPAASDAGETVYWTYDPALWERGKPEVHITLEAVAKDGKTLATAGALLTWDHGTAVVSR